MYALFAFLLFMFQMVRCELFSPISTSEHSVNYDEGSRIHVKSYDFANENEQQLSVTNKPGSFIPDSGMKKSPLFTLEAKLYFRTKEKRPIIYSIRKRDQNTKYRDNSSINERFFSQSQENVTSNLVNITSAVESFSKNNDENVEQSKSFFRKIHMTITRSRDALWAFTALMVLCILLAVAVLCSRMWQDHHGIPLYQPPIPDLNEKIPFKVFIAVLD
ncbi:uncharacterized protein LOC143237805 isoform X2 [Tachypleus tridentatus]|uniref:uncharacterized protein LOC143237805 isoform X2 n=1 Tax=Tachypleus tridentatus TaxID=6853 RepID=UPI003FCF17F2